MALSIKTNHRPRELKCWYDVPAKAREDFDYIEGEDRHYPRLFCYRGRWYDSNEFFLTPDAGMGGLENELRGWDAYQSDSFFSGVLLRYPRLDRWGHEIDCEHVIVGRYWS